MSTEQTRTHITTKELNDRIAAGEPIHLIDVSTPAEYRAAHVSGAQNVPSKSDELTTMMNDRKTGNLAPLYVMCGGGVRSKMVCARFPSAHVVNVDGGTKQWAMDKLPLVGDGSASSAACPVRSAIAVVSSYFANVRRMAGSELNRTRG